MPHAFARFMTLLVLTVVARAARADGGDWAATVNFPPSEKPVPLFNGKDFDVTARRNFRSLDLYAGGQYVASSDPAIGRAGPLHFSAAGLSCTPPDALRLMAAYGSDRRLR